MVDNDSEGFLKLWRVFWLKEDLGMEGIRILKDRKDFHRERLNLLHVAKEGHQIKADRRGLHNIKENRMMRRLEKQWNRALVLYGSKFTA